MITYLIDTDWVIDFLKGKKDIVNKLSELKEKGLGISIITLLELYEGVYGSKNSEKHLKSLEDFLTVIKVIGIDEDIAKIFGKERSKLRKRGELIDNFDLIIACTCLHYKIRLLTNNIKHYKRIEGLKIGLK